MEEGVRAQGGGCAGSSVSSCPRRCRAWAKRFVHNNACLESPLEGLSVQCAPGRGSLHGWSGCSSGRLRPRAGREGWLPPQGHDRQRRWRQRLVQKVRGRQGGIAGEEPDEVSRRPRHRDPAVRQSEGAPPGGAIRVRARVSSGSEGCVQEPDQRSMGRHEVHSYVGFAAGGRQG